MNNELYKKVMQILEDAQFNYENMQVLQMIQKSKNERN